MRYPSENKFDTRNVRSMRYGTETLAHLGHTIWAIIPREIKEEPSLTRFTREIKKWKTSNCPCELCKTYVMRIGYID